MPYSLEPFCPTSPLEAPMEFPIHLGCTNSSQPLHCPGMSTSLLHLPPELHSRVFDMLDCYSHLRLRSVNRYFRQCPAKESLKTALVEMETHLISRQLNPDSWGHPAVWPYYYSGGLSHVVLIYELYSLAKSPMSALARSLCSTSKRRPCYTCMRILPKSAFNKDGVRPSSRRNLGIRTCRRCKSFTVFSIGETFTVCSYDLEEYCLVSLLSIFLVVMGYMLPRELTHRGLAAILGEILLVSLMSLLYCIEPGGPLSTKIRCGLATCMWLLTYRSLCSALGLVWLLWDCGE